MDDFSDPSVAIGEILLHALDPPQARATGLPTRLLHYGLLCILALTVVGALKATELPWRSPC